MTDKLERAKELEENAATVREWAADFEKQDATLRVEAEREKAEPKRT